MVGKKRVPSADLAELLDSWTLSLRAERKSDKTVKLYGEGVRRFLRWCDQTATRPELTKPTVQAFVVALLDEGAEPATARSRQLSLKRFSAWLAAEGEIEADEIAGLRPPRVDVKVADPLTESELRALIKACQGKAMRDRRDEAIVRLMLVVAVAAVLLVVSLTSGYFAGAMLLALVIAVCLPIHILAKRRYAREQERLRSLPPMTPEQAQRARNWYIYNLWHR